MADNPLIAILRGLNADNAVDVADVLVDAGFRFIEVPLNSPDPLASIEAISNKHGDHAVVGAGTVMKQQDVTSVVNAGGRIIVSPNLNPQVGQRAVELGARWCPGVFTPTEAFEGLRLGASVLKFFPAELISPKAVSAMRAVLPREAVVAAVGGITPASMVDYLNAGADTVGLGSALFKPDYSLKEVQARANSFVTAYRSHASI
ncbi:MAG: 2-dehydro-3-deoxy-6-phosphogalactonate aldolase [Rhizobiaceae bacterium]